MRSTTGIDRRAVVPAPTTATAAFVVGHQDYSWTGDARVPGTAELPHRPGILHAALVRAPGPGPEDGWFQDYSRGGPAWRALCGVELLAVSPRFFDDAVRWSCLRCAGVVDLWLDDPRMVSWEREVQRPRQVSYA